MVYFIFDNPSDKVKMEFLYEYSTRDFKQIYPEHQLFGMSEMAKYVKKVITQTNSEDQLVFWYDFMGVLCWWICKILFKKRNIIILNILLKDKDSKKNKIAKYLYKVVLKKNVVATVTSEEYGEWLNKLLGVNRSYILLHDIYYGDLADIESKQENYVFCGGRNGRDWKKLIQIATNMPTTYFFSVMPRNIYEEIKNLIPRNMRVKCDIPENEFKEAIGKAALVVMPLDTQAPAGLIALFQAGSYKKCVITSNTVTTREYISEEKGILCSDLSEWIKSIDYLMENKDEASRRAERYNQFLNEQCSKEIYANSLLKIVRESVK